jgi:hypothetical protein
MATSCGLGVATGFSKAKADAPTISVADGND